MKRIRNIGLCLVATFAMSVVALSARAPAPASAAPAGISIPTVDFGGCLWDLVFCTVVKDEIVFGSAVGTATSSSVNAFQGIELEKQPCTSAGAKKGEVKTEPVTDELGWINKAKGEVGLEERPTTGELYAKFTCGETAVEVKGGVIGTITPINKPVSSEEFFTWIAAENKETGKQTVTKFEGGPTVEHQLKIGAGEYKAVPTNDEGKAKPTRLLEISTKSGSPQFVSAPHYFIDSESGGIPAGERVHTLGWGTLTLTPEGIAAAPTSCENAAGGYAANPEGPAGAAPGIGATEDFASWNCSNAGCPPGEIEYPPGSGKKAEKEFIVFPGGKEYLGQSLPWPSTLTEAVKGTIRTESTGVIVDLACIAHGVSEQGGALGGDTDHDTPAFLATPTVCVTEPGKAKQEPKTVNGSQIGGPLTSTVVFDAGSGKLSCVTEVEKKAVPFKGNTEGVLHAMTYEGQELILTK